MTFGGNRTSALYRVLGLIAYAALSPVMGALILIGGGVYFLVDIVWSLLTDKRFGDSNLLMRWSKALFMWPIQLLKWIATGRAFPGFLPTA